MAESATQTSQSQPQPQPSSTQEQEPVKKMKSLRTAINNLNDNFIGYSRVWSTSLDKLSKSMRDYETQLIKENDCGTLSVTAQIILEQSADRATKLTDEYMRQHKNLHNGVSKIGKIVDRQFSKNIGSFFVREKDLIREPANQHDACSLIYDFLMSEGCIDVAETLKKEAKLDAKETIDNREAITKILTDIQRHDVRAALVYLSEVAPHEARLRYDLQKQSTLQLVVNGKEKEALKSLKDLRFLGNDSETPRMMGAVLRGSAALGDPRYRDMFDEKIWDSLVQRMADVMAPTRSVMSELIESGRQAVSVLSGLQKTFCKTNLMIEEELPVEIKVKRQIHSTFTCPILKEQSSQRNPPMKLLCGHVISRDAMQRLSANRLISTRATLPRQTRLKCPYCPKEQSYDAAKQVLFSHVH